MFLNLMKIEKKVRYLVILESTHIISLIFKLLTFSKFEERGRLKNVLRRLFLTIKGKLC